MIQLDTPQSLADLSRNASVISTSSSSDSSPSLVTNTPRPRPIRTFSSPRSRSPAPQTPRASKAPSYLSRELGLTDDQPESRRPTAGARSKSRNPSVNGRVTAQDFQFAEQLGEGSYSTVMQATYLGNGQDYAIKIVDKGHLMRKNKVETAMAEKNALVRLGSGHPGIVRLHWTFQDEWSLYLVLDLAKNGEMQTRISRLGSLSVRCTQYYAAQIVDALDYMHSKGVIHRDLKPENLLLDDAYRIKITDFGTGKLLEPGDTATTFVGTSQYVSPELLEARQTTKSSDLWALGCIVYQMISGRFTFNGLSEFLTWQKIKALDYSFPDGFDPHAQHLIQNLLVLDPSQRLGAGPPGSDHDMKALRAHPFFVSINWDSLWSDPAPPLEPGLVKKQHHPPVNSDNPRWNDVGAVWDDLVGEADDDEDDDDDDDADGVAWAPDANAPPYALSRRRSSEPSAVIRHEDLGPMNELPRYAARHRARSAHALVEDDAEREGEPGAGVAVVQRLSKDRSVGRPHGVPTSSADTASIGSGTSSSEGSPVEKLGAVLQAMQLDRGRNRAQTPVQGNALPVVIDWSSVLQPGEQILFESPVQVRSIKRRASRLLPIAVSPMRPKERQLVLTTARLLCLKQSSKGRGIISVKGEYALRAEKGKERETRAAVAVTGVEARGEVEFVVSTTSKSQTFAVPIHPIAAAWVERIREAISAPSHGRTTRHASPISLKPGT